METISALDHGLDRGIYDALRRHADLYTVPDLELPWGWIALVRHGEIVSYFLPSTEGSCSGRIHSSPEVRLGGV